MKINFVYHTPKCLGAGYLGSEGLRRALERNDLLNYAFNQTGNLFIDIPKYQESPILITRGFLYGRMPLVARAGNQFKAAWQSESFYTRHGVKDSSTDAALQNQHHFNMYFTCAETDLDMYDIPTYWLPSWADTSVFKKVSEPIISDRLGFYGGKQGREDFLTDDLDMIEHFQTSLSGGDSTKVTEELCEEINKYEMHLAPPGRCYNSMCGRAFEVMACGRMVFQYLNEDTMFKHMEFFKDGKDIVYFRDKDELKKKWKYYLSRPALRREIAASGYDKVTQYHNENITAAYIVSCMEEEHTKWLKSQEKIPKELSEAYESL